MWFQWMFGYVSVFVHGVVRSVLVVGMGVGVMVGFFVCHLEVEWIVICEIELSVFVVSD